MTPEPSFRRWVVLSAILLGVIALFAAVSPFMVNVIHRHNPGQAHMIALGSILFLLGLCSVNALRVRAGRPPLTTPAESLACFVVLVMGCWGMGWSFVETQMPIITAAYMFGSPENGWVEHVIPHLPAWAMGPAEEPYASGFYMGLRTGMPKPWVLWLVPVLAWTAFGVVLAFFCMSLASLVSRQWIEHDRLTFPHAEVVMGIARGFLTNRIFWWGLGIAAVIPLWNDVFQKLWPILPKISLHFGAGDEGFEWFKGAWKIVPVLNIALLGIFYFVHRDILISMVLFFFVFAIEKYWFGIGGYSMKNADLLGSGDPLPWQNGGALIMLVLFGFWAGRHALGKFIRNGLKGADENGTLVSPRMALVGIVAGAAGIVGWLVLLGLKEPLPLLTLLITKTIGFIGMARVTMESGMAPNWPVNASTYAVLIGGTAAIAPAGFVALALAQSWLTGAAWSNQVSFTLQGEKIRSQFPLPRGLAITALLAVALAIVVSMYSTAWLGYHRGANNFGNWHYQWHGRIPFDQATESIRSEPVSADPKRWGWVGAGMGMMAVLLFLRTHVVGWFLHPIGFILAPMGMPGGVKGDIYVFTAVLAWIIKTFVLRLGGVETFERLKPFFAGFVIGHFIPGLLGGILDVIWFANTGHRLE